MNAINFFVNFICYAGIVGLAIYDGYSYWTRGGRDHVSLKGEMTGIGILGTFAGIFIGLLDFNVNDIPGSIPQLLEGLKTAFGTSIVGLFCSTGMTVAQAVMPVAFRKTGDPIADTLVRVFQEFEPMMGDLRDATKNNTTEIVAMRNTMEETMDKLAKGVTDEIIHALEKVISDFNKNLTEQFGENFNRLNDACFKLVEWQGNYITAIDAATSGLRGALSAFEALKIQTETMINQHQELLLSLERVGEGAGSLSEASDRIRTSCSAAESLLQNSERLIESLKSGVENTGSAFSHAVEGFERKTREVADATHVRSESLLEFVKQKTKESENAFTKSLEEMVKSVASASTMVRHDLEHLPRIGDAIETAALGAESAAKSASEAANAARAANEISGKTIDLSNEHIATAHKNLQEALVALTNGFAHAYRDYLDGLRRLANQ